MQQWLIAVVVAVVILFISYSALGLLMRLIRKATDKTSTDMPEFYPWWE